MRTRLLCALFLSAIGFGQESKLPSEFRREGERLKQDCSSFKSLFSCASALFTDHPLHIAAGSIAPQNGFGAGAAFSTGWNSESVRNTLNMDAVGATNGSWRAGAYLTRVYVRRPTIGVSTNTSSPSNLAVRESPTVQVYAEATSLNKVSFFGLGPDSHDYNRTYFGMREIVAGTHVVHPLGTALNLSLEGEVNGRFVDIRPSLGQASPSIETLASPSSVPGLNQQPAFLQLGEGIRMRPSLAGGHLQLNYSARGQQFITPGSAYNFQRFVGDFSHEFPLYHSASPSASANSIGPDDCPRGNPNDGCSKPPGSRNLSGSFAARVMWTQSFTSGNNVVPFYFQPTLGGSDLNGSPALASYQDYRFRAPNTFLVRGSFEHSIWGPLGITAMADWGKASFDHFDTDHMRHSYSAGLTLRAGAFPLVYLMFAWGGNEGTHTIGRMNTSLLGGAARPDLY